MVENKDSKTINAITRNHKDSNPKKAKTPKTPCWKCGEMHYTRFCPFSSHTCTKCKQKGHKEGYCSNDKTKPKPFHFKPKENLKTKGIFSIRNVESKRKFVTVELNGVPVKLQHDSASDITVISEENWIKIGQPATRRTAEAAITASGDNLKLLAEFHTDITIDNVSKSGRIFTSNNPELNVLGIETMDLFDLWSIPINSLVMQSSSVLKILQSSSSRSFQKCSRVRWADARKRKLSCTRSKTLVRCTVRSDRWPTRHFRRWKQNSSGSRTKV